MGISEPLTKLVNLWIMYEARKQLTVLPTYQRTYPYNITLRIFLKRR